MGKMILVAIDAHSKWIEAHVTSGSKSTITINKLMLMFSTHGMPDTIISYNASAFVGQEFQNFCHVNDIQHITSAPHHPSSNGLAERVVGIVKEGVKRMEGCDLETKLARFLFDYRVTPHSTPGIAPSELLMHRHLKTRLQLIKPDIGGKVAAQQTKQKGIYDSHAKARLFASGDVAYALRNHGNKESWVHGSIVEQTGPQSYIVRLEDGSVVRRHVDQLQRGITSHPVVPPALTVPIEGRRPLQLQEYVESSGEPNPLPSNPPARHWTRHLRISSSTVRLLLHQ